jgi:hypothetical protein
MSAKENYRAQVCSVLQSTRDEATTPDQMNANKEFKTGRQKKIMLVTLQNA